MSELLRCQLLRRARLLRVHSLTSNRSVTLELRMFLLPAGSIDTCISELSSPGTWCRISLQRLTLFRFFRTLVFLVMLGDNLCLDGCLIDYYDLLHRHEFDIYVISIDAILNLRGEDRSCGFELHLFAHQKRVMIVERKIQGCRNTKHSLMILRRTIRRF